MAVSNPPLRFTASEITLLYEACQQSGGEVSTTGSEFICKKVNGGKNVVENATVGIPPPTVSASAGKHPSYSGAALTQAAPETAPGDITKVHSIDKLLPLIRVNVTTRDQIVAALKEPISSSFDSTGTETAVFREDVAFWKTGGVGQLFTKRGPVKRTLVVYFKQGLVVYFQSGDQR